MICPACKNSMIVVERDDIELDHCTNCGGTWFDSGEIELLLARLGSKDTGTFLNRIRLQPAAKTKEKPRKCPFCLEKMTKTLIIDQPEILVDVCSRGQGIWFDGGELEDLVSNFPSGTVSGLDTNKLVSEFISDVFHTYHENKHG